MSTQSRSRRDLRGWPETRTGRRAITLAGLSVTGLVAILRHHERSWMVMLATALGLLPLALLFSEIALGKF